MTYFGIILGGVAGFLYWKFIGCTSGACPITSNKYISIAYGALLGSLLLSSIAGSSPSQSSFLKKFFGGDSTVTHTSIGQEEFMTIAADENTVIIDVRTPAEWKAGYIEGTDMFIDYNSHDFSERIAALDPSKTYVLYCRTDNRSGSACKVMTKAGFTKVYNLTGGISRWNGELKRD